MSPRRQVDSATASQRFGRVVAVVSSFVVTVAAVLFGTAAPAGAATTVASDDFARTSASGWGSAQTGGAWTVIGGSGSSVGPGRAAVANIQPGRSFRAHLGSTSAADLTVTGAFEVPTATEVYYNLEARRQSNGYAYRGRVRITANRELKAEVVRFTGSGTGELLTSVSSATTVAAGQSVTVKLSVSGSNPVTVSTKAYVTGTTEPGWQASYADSSASRISGAGAVGAGGENSAHNSAAVTLAAKSISATTDTASTPPPAPPAPEAPEEPASSGSTGTGSAAVGTTSYAVPSGAVFVSPSGNDAAAGTSGAPLKTVTKAIAKVPAGGTIVMRGGSYHEYFIIPPSKPIKLQSYPKEAVWLDGTRTVSGFAKSGSVWKAPWTVKFDSSPTYTKGAPDGTAAGWQFVNPAYPMAAHPDAVWINDVELTQVGSLSAVTAGKFYVDGTSMYVGTDPTGKTVKASDLSQAMSLRAPGTVIRGIGVRRYGDSVYMQGVINSYFAGQTLENVVVADAATGGIGLYGTGSTLRNVTIDGAGQMGFSAGKADNLVLDNVLVRNANDQHFNPAPSAGGVKITTTRGVTVKNSRITGTDGNSLWFDESAYNITAVNNVISDGNRYGIVLEISSLATVAGNLISNTGYDGLMITNTDKVNVWNNTIVGSKKSPILICQDTRRITNLSVAGHDSRRAQPDLSMPWVVSGISIGNNILSATGSSGAILTAQAYDKSWSASNVISSNGNVFAQPSAGVPAMAVIWSVQNANPSRYPTVAGYVSATGKDQASFAMTGSPVTSALAPTSTVTAKEASTAQALPTAVAALVGKAAGTKHLGAWVR
jgi:parallel beta-helix repeat protein